MADHIRRSLATMARAMLVALVMVFAAQADPIVVQGEPVPLNALEPTTRRVGGLEYRGGLRLSSPDERFGGLSDLLVSADGQRLTGVSDRGYWVQARLSYDSGGELAGVAEVEVYPLLDLDGHSLARRPEGDAEGLAAGAHGEGLVVSFETRPRLWTYPGVGGLPAVLTAPVGLDKTPGNAGLEAITRLADNRLLALTEGLRVEGGIAGWIGGERGLWSSVTWHTGDGFQPTGLATLPDGDVLVLERRMLPPGARVRLLAAPRIRDEAVLDGEEIARFEGTLTFDNFEGISARPGSGGESLVYLISDDNHSFLQRTLLMMFRIVANGSR